MNGNWDELEQTLHNRSELKRIRCAKPYILCSTAEPCGEVRNCRRADASNLNLRSCLANSPLALASSCQLIESLESKHEWCRLHP